MTNDQCSDGATKRQGEDSERSRGGRSPSQFDLAERTAKLAEDVIRFVRKVPIDAVTAPLVTQLVKAGTSIGANYCEADEAGSRKEFRYRISVCGRESRESKYWLRMIAVAVETLPGKHEPLIDEARRLWRESHELNRIFASIHRNSRPGPPPWS
ncbi:MAG: four helix bundle protein [Planctomycetes bacterium]|nr:four helix bundle protein [Planctomycetota bacterium]